MDDVVELLAELAWLKNQLATLEDSHKATVAALEKEEDEVDRLKDQLAETDAHGLRLAEENEQLREELETKTWRAERYEYLLANSGDMEYQLEREKQVAEAEVERLRRTNQRLNRRIGELERAVRVTEHKVKEQIDLCPYKAEVEWLREALNPDLCLTCGEEHPETVLRWRDGKPYETSWAHNGHSLKRRANWPGEWAALARKVLQGSTSEVRS